MVWEERNRRTDPNPFRPLSNRGGYYLGRWANIATKMVLTDPDGIEAQLFGVAGFIEEVLVVLLLGTILSVLIEEGQ
jgi:hypothetical protein